MVDQVKVAADEQAPTEQSLRRNLTNRHIQLIAIGGAIGTGLFMAQAKPSALPGRQLFCLYDHRLYAVFRHARHGRTAAVESRIQVFQRFCRRPAGPLGRLFYRLDLLVLLGSNRDGGRGGDHRLRAVLVPGLSDWSPRWRSSCCCWALTSPP